LRLETRTVRFLRLFDLRKVKGPDGFRHRTLSVSIDILWCLQVTPSGLADKAGIRLGDIILEINEEDASQLTLSQAHEKINSTPKKIHFLLRK